MGDAIVAKIRTSKMKLNIAIAGATGNVGRKIIEVLEKRNFPLIIFIYWHPKIVKVKKSNFLRKKL